jgi:mono/diheme cytochrome c family protein
VIQHKTYLTPYLKDQIAARNLETAVAMGRIWRVKPKGKLRPVPHLAAATDAELAVLLKKPPDGWTRDTAQRLLIERRPADLRSLLGVETPPRPAGEPRTPFDPLADRLVAPTPAELWTLQATGQLRPSDLSAAVMNDDPALAETVALLCGEAPGWDAVAASMLTSRHRRVRWMAALALGPGRKEADPRGRHAEELLKAALAEDDRVMRGCVVNALVDFELEALAVLASGKNQGKIAGMLAADLADSCLRGPSAARRGALLAWAAGEPPEPLRRAVIDRVAGLIGIGRPSGAKRTAIAVDTEPSAWLAMADGRGPLAGRAREIAVWLDWPGRPEADRGAKPAPLTPEQQASFDRGKVVFATTCAACHGPEGRGVPGQTPPLAGSPRATGPVSRVARIVLHGMDGSFERDGSVYNGQMPAAVSLSDRQIGDVLTFVRRSWGNSAAPIPGSQVLSVRVKSAGRSRPWMVGEIDSFPEEEP